MIINCWLALLFLLQFRQSVEGNEDLSSSNEHFDEDFKYLPEFNIEPVKYNKWSKYYDIIEKNYIDYHRRRKKMMEWISNDTQCDIFKPLVDAEMFYFENMFGKHFITKEIIDEMTKQQVVHYQIVDHKLYRSKYCLFPIRCEGVEYFLKLILDELPNMDLFINVRDYPQVGRFYPINRQFPIFSFSRLISDYADLTYPAWAFWSGGPALDIYPRGIGRWDLTRELLLEKQKDILWEMKKKVAFFRGSRTSSQRDAIILLGRSRPDLIEAKYTKNQAWKSKADTLGDEPARTVSFEDHCQYRYLVNAHGVAASFRLKHLFLCGSLVLNIQSDWIEFFYPPLIPWVHFVPISSDFSDAAQIIEFLNENDELAKRIAKRGFEFIRDRLTIDSVDCYWRYLLHSYSNKLVSYRSNRVDDDLIKV